MDFDGTLNLPKKVARAVKAAAREREKQSRGVYDDSRLSSSFQSSDDTNVDYYKNRRRHKHESRRHPSKDKERTSSRKSDARDGRSVEVGGKEDSIYLSEMVRYRELWQQSQVQMKEVERKHWEEMQMKETAFTKMIDGLQQKFDDCKTGLARLASERDEAEQKVAELTSNLQTMSASFNREAAANARNAQHGQELENALRELQEAYEAAKQKIVEITEQNKQIDALQATCDTQARQIAEYEIRTAKLIERDRKRKRSNEKNADVMAQQEEEIDRLRTLAATQDERITSQKKQIVALTQKLDELDTAESKRQTKMEAQKKDLAYLTGYQEKQDEIMKMQKEQIAKLCRRVNELKGAQALADQLQHDVTAKTERLFIMEKELKDKCDALKTTLSRKKSVEKKLDAATAKLHSKEYLTYVPLCQNCKALRVKMSKWKKTASKNQSVLKKKIESLQEQLAKSRENLFREMLAQQKYNHRAQAAAYEATVEEVKAAVAAAEVGSLGGGVPLTNPDSISTTKQHHYPHIHGHSTVHHHHHSIPRGMAAPHNHHHIHAAHSRGHQIKMASKHHGNPVHHGVFEEDSEPTSQKCSKGHSKKEAQHSALFMEGSDFELDDTDTTNMSSGEDGTDITAAAVRQAIAKHKGNPKLAWKAHKPKPGVSATSAAAAGKKVRGKAKTKSKAKTEEVTLSDMDSGEEEWEVEYEPM